MKLIWTILLEELLLLRSEICHTRLLQIAADVDWQVREAAHSAMSSLLVAHFDAFHQILQAWAEHPSPDVRRGAAIAAREAAKERREESAAALLDLIEPLLADRKEYVRKNSVRIRNAALS